MSKKVMMVCSHCGGEDVRADEYVECNVDSQSWEIAQVFEKGAFCSDCDGETRIEERKTSAV